MKTIVASIVESTPKGTEAVKMDIELVTGQGTVALVSQENHSHIITVDVPDDKINSVIAILNIWGWTISDP
jgi:hypothetical protein